jgi:hypothetical protein
LLDGLLCLPTCRIAALPDRIEGVPLPGEYFEALAALLLEQPRPGGSRAVAAVPFADLEQNARVE